MFRDSRGLHRDHGRSDGYRTQTEACGGSAEVWFGGRCSSDGGHTRGGTRGRTGGGAGAFGLEHPTVGLVDVTVPGEGGRRRGLLLLTVLVHHTNAVVVTV